MRRPTSPSKLLFSKWGYPAPNAIYVYNFISSLSQRLMPASAEEEDTGRQLGAAIARDLTADINAMGMYAVHAGPGSQPQVGDGVIRGYIVLAKSDSMGKRFMLGFGSGKGSQIHRIRWNSSPTSWRNSAAAALLLRLLIAAVSVLT